MTDDFKFKRFWGPEPSYPTVLSIEKKDHELITIAGPCSIESREQVMVIAKELAKVGCTYMRGGVFRAGTYPPKDFGLNLTLLNMFSDVANDHGLSTIVEVLDHRQLDVLDKYANAFQVGARHMQDYALLDILSRCDKPVTLKRNMGATMDEFLGAAEYLVRNGKRDVMLIERGSSTHENHSRWTLSVSMIAAIKRITGIPIIVDASHASGRRDLVEDLTLAGIACGGDGFLVEVHPEPELSISDSDQALPLARYRPLVEQAHSIRWTRRNWGGHA